MRYEAAWQELRQRAGAGRGAVAGGMLGPQPAGAGSPTAAGSPDNVVPLPARHDLHSGQAERLHAPLASQPNPIESVRATPPPLPSQAEPAPAPGEMGKTALERLVKEAIKTANDDLAWYNNRAKHVKRMSRGLRRWAIYLGLLGGLCPLLGESVFGVIGPLLKALYIAVFAPNVGEYVNLEASQVGQAMSVVSASGTGLVFFALAAGFLLIDQVFGYSSSWMRYRLTELRLGKLVRTFKLEVESELAMFEGRSLPHEQAKSILARLKAFVAGLEDIRIEETETWVAEFKAGLLQMEQFTRNRGKPVEGQK
jgi:hypothetical protein